RLFLWQKSPAAAARGTILFVHGSSMASQPTFDLQVPGRPDSSAMEWFAARGFDTWCLDNEGYGRSDKSRPINCDISNGADDLDVASQYVLKNSGQKKILVYGISSGALKAALFTQRHPERVARLALDAFVWTGEGSPTLAERRKRLPEFQSKNRRPIDRAFVRSIFQRDHPGAADDATIEAFATAILALDDSVPTGTYVDMCSKLPLVDPARRRRHHRRRLRGEKRAGWLHAALHRDAPRHQRLGLQEAALRSAQGLRAGGAGRLGTLRPGGQSAAPRPLATRAHRRGESATGKDRLCELGQRQRAAPRECAIRLDGWHRVEPWP